MPDRVVVEVARRGKLVVGEPFFTPGVPIVLDRKGLADVGPGQLAVVTTGRGRARLERPLGPASSIESVLDGLLEHEGMRGADEPYEPPEPTLDGRVDLRDQLSFTIDPDTAKDFDDAISIGVEGDGLRAWVHIADVSHFVPAGSPLDQGASERGFSVYVPGRVAPMLPPELSEDLCSLRPRLDRLCVTVEVPFDGNLAAGEASFYRSVIRSRERLTYGGTERILNGSESADPDVTEALKLAERLAVELRRRRFARGALRITTDEVNFSFDGNGGVERAWLESEPHAHMLVEELMILANEAVGALLAGRRREALYRIHERPDPQAIGHLLAKLADLDVPTPPAPAEEQLTPGIAAGLAAQVSDRVTAYVEESGRGRDAFPALVLRSLKQARYDPRNLGHSGLASAAYCHFTSPIRRYPDLVCHRALLRELGVSDDPGPEEIGELAEHLSVTERAAANIEYRADDLCLAWLLGTVLFERGWDAIFEGEVTGVIPSGLFARFGEVFEGLLPARRLPGDYYELNELGTALVGRRGGRTFRLGDTIEIRVEDIDRQQGKVGLSLAA
ncbi:MAG: RNB domain-containing ribonuclease [Actinobacteria bacterium]|nr:RNB domain-containing ribonuclease [Actinomycetota bacterium]